LNSDEWLKGHWGEEADQNRCGWGSGALYFAEVLPNSKITAFSNSRTQKIYIDSKIKEKGLTNLTVITGNVVDYEFEKGSYDRVVSIEVCHMISFLEVC
jgi:cation-transporting ATPase 13A2